MATTVVHFWMSGWASNVLKSFVQMLKDSWTEGDMPIIDDVMNYRSLDLANKEYVLLEVLEENDSFLGLGDGLGGGQYRKDIVISVILKTGVSDLRVRQMLEECRRIFRTKSYWAYDYQNIKLGRNVNMSNRERKVWSYLFNIEAIKLYNIDLSYKGFERMTEGFEGFDSEFEKIIPLVR